MNQLNDDIHAMARGGHRVTLQLAPSEALAVLQVLQLGIAAGGRQTGNGMLAEHTAYSLARELGQTPAIRQAIAAGWPAEHRDDQAPEPFQRRLGE